MQRSRPASTDHRQNELSVQRLCGGSPSRTRKGRESSLGTGRARWALPVEKIKTEFEKELRARAGNGKVAVVESLVWRYRVSPRPMYRVLATPS
jgi:hypothetical protein